MHGFRQTADELVVLYVLLLDKRFDASLVSKMVSIITVEISRDMTNRSVPLFGERAVIIMWARRCARVGWIDRDSILP